MSFLTIQATLPTGFRRMWRNTDKSLAAFYVELILAMV